MIISYFITIVTKTICLIIYLHIFFFILNLIFFLISKLWKFICDIFPSYKQKEKEIDWHKFPYTPFDYFKDNERITSFHNFIISHPLFLTIRIVTSFFYFFIRPFQYLFGMFWLGFYIISFTYHWYYKKDIIFKKTNKKYLVEYIFIEIPKARAYNILYKILRKIFLKEKEIITLEKLSKIFIIFFTSRFFTSSKNITYIDNITIQTYLTLLNEDDQIWHNYYNNLIWYKKYFMLFKKTIRDLKAIVKNSEYIRNSSNQKILYKKNNWIFNPPKYVTEKALHLLPQSSNSISCNYTFKKNKYIKHLAFNSNLNFKNYKDQSIITSNPLDDQLWIDFIDQKEKQKICYNNFSENCLIKEYDGVHPKLAEFISKEKNEVDYNIMLARMNDSSYPIAQTLYCENKRLGKERFYEEILNSKILRPDYITNIRIESILEEKNKYNFLAKEKIFWRKKNDPIMIELIKINTEIELKTFSKFNTIWFWYKD